ncbi:MAG TPA: SMC-Scp complex subunit ScpB [Candidatus Methylomirabilis sp.]|nr:SMC-Scp complex subunit ScpB [Candidatus Methylomirabilis sp.]
MSESNPELKNIIEAALLVAGQPLTIDKMLTMFPADSPPTREEIRDVLERLAEEYAERVMELKQIDRSWRFQTRDKYAPWIQRLAEERPVRYSRALLETLAIIAYRQPVTRGDIEEIRGVSVSTDIIKTLLGREWVRQVGVRNVPGRPALYGTTREFLEHFNLGSLEELPPLSALRDLDIISKELNLRLDLEPGSEAPAASPEAMPGSDEAASAGAESEPVMMNEAQAAGRD